MIKRGLLLLTLLLLSLLGIQDAGATTFTVQFENDEFGGTDNYYTHATVLRYTYNRAEQPAWLSRLGSTFLANDNSLYQIFLGQHLYTPADISLSNPPPTDRPYGGWLYLGTQIFTSRSDTIRDCVAFSVGVVGPGAGGRETQTLVHKLVHAQKPKGWSHQLPNEPAINLLAEREWTCGTAAPGQIGYDFVPYAGGCIGNVFIYADAGVTARFGYNMPRSYRGGIRPSVLNPANGAERRIQRSGFFVFAGAEGRLVAHNIFVDGSLFQSSRGVDGNPWVSDLTTGVTLTLLNWEVSYSYVQRSREFKGQPQSEKFGGVSASHSW